VGQDVSNGRVLWDVSPDAAEEQTIRGREESGLDARGWKGSGGWSFTPKSQNPDQFNSVDLPRPSRAATSTSTTARTTTDSPRFRSRCVGLSLRESEELGGLELGHLYLCLVQLWHERDGAFFEDRVCGRRIWMLFSQWLMLVKPFMSADTSSATLCVEEDGGCARGAEDRPFLLLSVALLSAARLGDVVHSIW